MGCLLSPTSFTAGVYLARSKRLDQCNAEPWQVGIQFFQVGNESEAAEDLQELNDSLANRENVRDIINTVL
jgi:hypothetical protein